MAQYLRQHEQHVTIYRFQDVGNQLGLLSTVQCIYEAETPERLVLLGLAHEFGWGKFPVWTNRRGTVVADTEAASQSTLCLLWYNRLRCEELLIKRLCTNYQNRSETS